MPTYSPEDFENIAATIGVKVRSVIPYRNEFEAAAASYRFHCRTPRRVRPSSIKSKAKKIARAANKLLRHLAIYDYRDAADGPQDWALLEALASTQDATEDGVLRATESVGRLAEIFDGFDAAQFLERQAGNAAADAMHISRLISEGHRGDLAENDWIAVMMSLYEKIAGRKAGTSSIAPGRPGSGKASGPLIRFLAASGAPMGIKYSAESWRGRVRDNRTGGRRRK